MSQAIDDLRHEHSAIISALRVLDRMDDKIERGEKVDGGDMGRLLGFFKEFVDTCHHGKEEGILFPSLAKAGIPENGKPVSELLTEHTQGRKLIKEMENAVTRGPDYKAFADAGKEYSAKLRTHIQKETLDLFPTAERTLSQKQLDSLYEAFEQYENDVIGAGRHEQLHHVLDDLRQNYLT